VSKEDLKVNAQFTAVIRLQDGKLFVQNRYSNLQFTKKEKNKMENEMEKVEIDPKCTLGRETIKSSKGDYFTHEGRLSKIYYELNYVLEHCGCRALFKETILEKLLDIKSSKTIIWKPALNNSINFYNFNLFY